MKTKIISSALLFTVLFSSCTNQEDFSNEEIKNSTTIAQLTAKESNSDDVENFIALSNKTAISYKKMLFYITENSKSNDLSDINNSVEDYYKNVDANFIDSSQEISFLTPNDINADFKLTGEIENIFSRNNEIDGLISDLKTYLTVLEKSKYFNENDHITANMLLSVAEYINENPNDRFGLVSSNENISLTSRKKCAVGVIGAAGVAAFSGCIMGGNSGLIAGIHGAAAGCVLGGMVGFIGGALSAYGSLSACN